VSQAVGTYVHVWTFYWPAIYRQAGKVWSLAVAVRV